MKSCLIITVYENRYTNLINWLESPKSWIREKLDIFLLVQENDPCKDEYNSLCNYIKILYCDAKNICEKRKYGYAAAAAVILFFCIMIFTFIELFFKNKNKKRMG